MNDHDGLKYVVDSNRFDLKKTDNLGYSKEFWCYYYQNWKALHVIQSKKLEMDGQQEEETFMMNDLEQSFGTIELGTSPSNLVAVDSDSRTIENW